MNYLPAKYIAILPILAAFSGAYAQAPSATPALSQGGVTAEQKQRAYSKMMEGQRYLIKSTPDRTAVNASIDARLAQIEAQKTNIRLAQTAFQRAVELDPDLAEAYTALSELALNTPPSNVDEAINLSSLATKVDADNFGGHRILARLYTFKSHMNSDRAIDKGFADKATAEWKEVARLDPRSAEAWAFLSEFYSLDGNADEQISSLRKWVAAAVPVDTQFYRGIMRMGDLSPERASVKLGRSLVATGKTSEAISVISEVIADNPDYDEAIDILQEAIEGAGSSAAASAIKALEPAVYANPGNIELVNLLSQIHTKAGNSDEALKVLRNAYDRVVSTNKPAAGAYSVSIGDLFASNDKVSEAIDAYERALSLRGIREGQAVADRDREFVVQVFDKMIRAYKSANRNDDAKAVIDRARKLLGKDDLFADKQVIAMYRESGRRQDALSAARALRSRFPSDYGLLRLEASILTESGMVDQGVTLIRNLIEAKSVSPAGDGDSSVPSVPALFDDFTNYIFISHLYNEANRGNDARLAADQAYNAAGSDDRRQLAKLTVATSQQVSGDYAAAESTLREILRQTPGNPIALNNLGYVLVERNERLTEALTLIQKAIRIDPTNPSYLDSLGWANFRLGNLEEAERNLRNAARIDYASATIQEHLGDVYDKQGKQQQARTFWQRALDLSTNEADANRIRIKLRQ